MKLRSIAIPLLATSALVSSLAVLPRRAVAMDEVIVINDCATGFLGLGSGDNFTCVPDPSYDWGSGSEHPRAPDDRGTDTPGGGSWDENADGMTDRAEELRAKYCGKCSEAANKCLAHAQLATTTCLANAEFMARWRCDIPGRGLGHTMTAWGCAISDLQLEQCPSAEPPWNRPSRWDFSCGPTAGGGYACEGRGVESCVSSWRVSHPEGSIVEMSTGGYNATFDSVGAQRAETFTTSYSYSGRTGYLSACAALGAKLSQSCTGKQNACYARWNCP